jgi:hypothetical protein
MSLVWIFCDLIISLKLIYFISSLNLLIKLGIYDHSPLIMKTKLTLAFCEMKVKTKKKKLLQTYVGVNQYDRIKLTDSSKWARKSQTATASRMCARLMPSISM